MICNNCKLNLKKFPPEKIKQIRCLTGSLVSIDDCQVALNVSDGDITGAFEFLRKCSYGDAASNRKLRRMRNNIWW